LLDDLLKDNALVQALAGERALETQRQMARTALEG
jgi:hypothetical protein